MAEQEKAYLKFRPVYAKEPSIAEAAQVAVIGTVVLTIFGATLFVILLAITGLGKWIPYWIGPMLFFLGGAVGLPPWYMEMKRRAYKKTFYAFYDDRVEFEIYPVLFFQDHVRDRVYYDDIDNVGERASFWQRRAGLCTIYIFAPALQNPDRRGFMGLKITDVPSDKNLVQRISDIITGNLPEMAKGAATPSPSTEGGEHGRVGQQGEAAAAGQAGARPPAADDGQAAAPSAPAEGGSPVGGTGGPEDKQGA